MSDAVKMPEAEYRALVQGVYDRILKQLDQVDPDAVEAEMSQGTLSLRLADGARWILSGQPPVRQLWLAVASKGRAFHFDYDPRSATWRDDKGEGVELFGCLESLLDEVAQVRVKF
jgi:CyaY protein